MTKFELAEMIGLRYSRAEKRQNHNFPVYVFYVDANCTETVFNIYPYFDKHDLDWAKNEAAEKFFEQLVARTFS